MRNSQLGPSKLLLRGELRESLELVQYQAGRRPLRLACSNESFHGEGDPCGEVRVPWNVFPQLLDTQSDVLFGFVFRLHWQHELLGNVVAGKRDPIGTLRFRSFRQIAENPSREFSIG